MDTNYLLKREQVSLVLAQCAAGLEARHAHAALAKAYGLLLAKNRFPHRQFKALAIAQTSGRAFDRWVDDGGRSLETST